MLRNIELTNSLINWDCERDRMQASWKKHVYVWCLDYSVVNYFADQAICEQSKGIRGPEGSSYVWEIVVFYQLSRIIWGRARYLFRSRCILLDRPTKIMSESARRVYACLSVSWIVTAIRKNMLKALNNSLMWKGKMCQSRNGAIAVKQKEER